MATIVFMIIGIVLATATATMMFFHGGDAFVSGTARVESVTIVNKLSQVISAVRYREASGAGPLPANSADARSKLVDEGLLAPLLVKQIGFADANGSGAGLAAYVFITSPYKANSNQVCSEINKYFNLAGEIRTASNRAEWQSILSILGKSGCFRVAQNGNMSMVAYYFI